MVFSNNGTMNSTPLKPSIIEKVVLAHVSVLEDENSARLEAKQ